MVTKKTFNVLLLALVIISSAFTLAQQPNQDEMMKKWMDYMTPGEVHEKLAKSVGEWTYVSKWWNDPSSDPQVSEGRAVNEMILGGRYLKSMNYGTVMGMPMEGMNLLAYDKALNEFFSLWVDNMGTGMTMVRGRYNEASKSIEMKGTMVDPTSAKEIEYRQTMKFIDDNKHLLEMVMNYEGKEFKMLEMMMTRKK